MLVQGFAGNRSHEVGFSGRVLGQSCTQKVTFRRRHKGGNRFSPVMDSLTRRALHENNAIVLRGPIINNLLDFQSGGCQLFYHQTNR